MRWYAVLRQGGDLVVSRCWTKGSGIREVVLASKRSGVLEAFGPFTAPSLHEATINAKSIVTALGFFVKTCVVPK